LPERWHHHAWVQADDALAHHVSCYFNGGEVEWIQSPLVCLIALGEELLPRPNHLIGVNLTYQANNQPFKVPAMIQFSHLAYLRTARANDSLAQP
jgi:hypothetical protein